MNSPQEPLPAPPPPPAAVDDDDDVLMDARDDGDNRNKRKTMSPSLLPQASTSTTSIETSTTMSSLLPENRFELELEFLQALASPAYIHFLATSRTSSIDDAFLDVVASSTKSSIAQQQKQQQEPTPPPPQKKLKTTTGTTTSATTTAMSSTTATTTAAATNATPNTLQYQLQPFLQYLYKTYSQPEYARFLRYPHALYFLQSLLMNHDDNDDTTLEVEGKSTNAMNNTNSNSNNNNNNNNTQTNKIWTEWTNPSFRNFCHQQQFCAWQYRHATCYGVGRTTPIPLPPSTTTATTTINSTSNINDTDNTTVE
jgi:SOH1